MDAKLTQSQSWAVKSPGGPILVSAAAGSGKTMVLVSRLLDQILDPELSRDVDEFLIITFTKKAASELRARIARELSARLAEQPENKHLQRQLGRVYLARISTVHAFCAELLREFALDLDLPVDFRVAEESECREIRAQCLRRLLDERYGKIEDDLPLRTLVDGLGAGRDDRQIERLIEGVYDTSQCRLYPDRWIKSCAKTMDTDLYPTAQDTPWGAYLIGRLQAVLRQRHKELSALLPKLELTEGMAPYAGACCAAMEAIASLSSCQTWDEIVSARDRGWGFPRLPGVRNCPAPELQARFKALRTDEFYNSTHLPYGSRNWDGAHWRKRLEQIVTFSQKEDIRRFFLEKVEPAFSELQTELEKYGIQSEILKGKNGPLSIELSVPHVQIRNFRYGVTAEKRVISDYLVDEDNTPDADNGTQYIPVTYYSDGRTGNDIQYLSKNEIIADVLREYGRYISSISDNRNAMVFVDKKPQ